MFSHKIITDIYEWLILDETYNILYDNGIYRLIIYENNDNILNFSYSFGKKYNSYNCLITEYNNQIIFTIITSDGLYKKFNNILSFNNILHIIITEKTHKNIYYKNGNTIIKDIKKINYEIDDIEEELNDLEYMIKEDNNLIMTKMCFILGITNKYNIPSDLFSSFYKNS